MNHSKEIYEILHNRFPGSKCFLDHNNVFELLCAVMMSAQTTDERVNSVTKILFKKYPTPKILKDADINDVINIIKPIGLANAKAKNLISLAKIIDEEYNGEVPCAKEELTKLPGVGNKTANVVLAVGFNVPEIAVDTHVYRTSYRLGLREENDSLLECEYKLKAYFPIEHWIEIHHLLILFGRNYCKAKKPLCDTCILKDYCKHGV